jgi:hypothetical protein
MKITSDNFSSFLENTCFSKKYRDHDVFEMLSLLNQGSQGFQYGVAHQNRNKHYVAHGNLDLGPTKDNCLLKHKFVVERH